jgi:hypothetical protein
VEFPAKSRAEKLNAPSAHEFESGEETQWQSRFCTEKIPVRRFCAE